ncbi:hypothetical protein EDB84DRAFT_86388 [Lactarius hengduanensis]|nr:hypothetical protein EDB84DRAFT_86388 [Lactarius hengduanensis]
MIVETYSEPDWGILSPLSDTSLLQSNYSPQVETLVPPLDSHSTTGGFDPSIHGSNGSVNISVQDTTALDFRTFNTTTQLAEFSFNEDINSGSPLRIGMFCLFIYFWIQACSV